MTVYRNANTDRLMTICKSTGSDLARKNQSTIPNQSFQDHLQLKITGVPPYVWKKNKKASVFNKKLQTF